MKYKGKIGLYVYPGAEGYSELYEDENVNYNYEKGKFAVILFIYNEKISFLPYAFFMCLFRM
jgi:alpha-D-xyloside xylohydrolase